MNTSSRFAQRYGAPQRITRSCSTPGCGKTAPEVMLTDATPAPADYAALATRCKRSPRPMTSTPLSAAWRLSPPVCRTSSTSPR